jgi:RHS repeat-associated protein
LLADEQVHDLFNAANNETLSALTDHLGSVRDLVDSSGTVQNHKSYDAFGNVTAETNAAVDTAFGYTGKLFDDATGLQNNLNRWYDPEVGRWLSEDPIGFASGDANLYRYVGNSPTIRTDPAGLDGELPPPDWRFVDSNTFRFQGLVLYEKDWQYTGKDRFGRDLWVDPAGGDKVWASPDAENGIRGGMGRMHPDGYWVPVGAIDIGPEPPTLDLAIEGTLTLWGASWVRRMLPRPPGPSFVRSGPLSPYDDPGHIGHGHPAWKPWNHGPPELKPRPPEQLDPGHTLWDDDNIWEGSTFDM